MARYRVELTGEEREALLAKVSRGRGAAAEIKRANLLLAVDRGEFADLRMSDGEAARAYRATAKTVYNLKRRLVEEGLEAALSRKPRSGPSRVKLDGEAEAKIVALTRADPPEGHARWTLRVIAQRSVELGYVESISHVAVGRMLKKTSCAHGHAGSGASRSTPASS